MKLILTICVFAISCPFNNSQAQQKANKLDSFVGTWKGTSLCQVKNSPCHDEVVVYHITKANTEDSCAIQANKIVNGVEEDMGTLPFRFDKTTNTIESSAYGKWSFKLKDGKLEGTLYARNSLYRIIELSKIK